MSKPLELEGPLLVFGGPYSNLQATEAMRATARELGIPPERCICTGDIIAYCANPVETLAVIRDWGCSVVMGNCEESLAEDANDCGCGFEEGTACDLLSKQWFDFATARMTPDMRAWMGARPRSLRINLEGVDICFTHGGVDEINRFIFPGTPDEVFEHQFARAGVDVIVGGHSGIPFEKTFAGKRWINAGVIGMPANDGTPDGWYAILDGAAQGLQAHFHRLAYDYAGARDAMRLAGLAEGYAGALETGLWPSLDVLTEAEKAVTGQALSF